MFEFIQRWIKEREERNKNRVEETVLIHKWMSEHGQLLCRYCPVTGQSIHWEVRVDTVYSGFDCMTGEATGSERRIACKENIALRRSGKNDILCMQEHIYDPITKQTSHGHPCSFR